MRIFGQDAGEMRARRRRDAGETRARRGQDAGETRARLGEMRARCGQDVGETRRRTFTNFDVGTVDFRHMGVQVSRICTIFYVKRVLKMFASFTIITYVSNM